MVAPFEEMRALVSTAPEPDVRLEAYLQKVRTRAYTVTDADVEALKNAGLTEDEIFEATATVAMSEGLRRLEAAFLVLE
jgi:alkylhydroperoxidase/carboxymuconolactone decarboxylase family protein YurZ